MLHPDVDHAIKQIDAMMGSGLVPEEDLTRLILTFASWSRLIQEYREVHEKIKTDKEETNEEVEVDCKTCIFTTPLRLNPGWHCAVFETRDPFCKGYEHC